VDSGVDDVGGECCTDPGNAAGDCGDCGDTEDNGPTPCCVWIGGICSGFVVICCVDCAGDCGVG
jgi:hypothetical protein